MKLEDLTIKQIVDTCYSTKFCNDCMLHYWCHTYLEKPPTDWKIHGYTDKALPVEVKEVQDDRS